MEGEKKTASQYTCMYNKCHIILVSKGFYYKATKLGNVGFHKQ